MLVIKDSVLAAFNSVQKIWPEASITPEAICHTHSSLIWISHHSHDFKYYTNSKSVFQANLIPLKDCPHVNTVAVMQEKMHAVILKFPTSGKIWLMFLPCKVAIQQLIMLLKEAILKTSIPLTTRKCPLLKGQVL
jgi:hypothetical protein